MIPRTSTIDAKDYTPAEKAVVYAEWDEMRAVFCDYCKAEPGEWCRNLATGTTFQHGPGHHTRILAATR